MTSAEQRKLRAAFGAFMTGVTVVSTRDKDGTPLGFTANSFSSVSLDPPLILVCPGRFLTSFEAFETCQKFSVSVLAEGQEEISNHFASFTGDRFAGVHHELDCHNVPCIQGSIAQFSCETHQVVPAGDHIILIGEVKDYNLTGERGLGYAGGNYFSLGLEQDVTLASSDALDPHVGVIIEWQGAVYLEQNGDGYVLPSFRLGHQRNLRAALDRHLIEIGVKVDPDRVYSVFDDLENKRHYTFFRGAAIDVPRPGKGRLVPIADLPTLTYASAAQATMLMRYTVEYQSSTLGP